MPSRVVSLFKSRSFKIALAIILFIAAVLIILAMMLGNEAGQFVIRVQSGAADKSIALSDSEDFSNNENQKSTLIVDGVNGMGDYSPRFFLETGYQTLNEYTKNVGVPNKEELNDKDPRALGLLYVYTFYIVNTSKSGSSVGVNIALSYSNVTNHTDEVIRVLTYYQSSSVSDPRVYQKVDDEEKLGLSEPYVYRDYILQPYMFADSSRADQGVVFNDQSVHIGSKEGENYIKYSVFFWIEGDDPDSEYYDTQLYAGTIKFRLDISVDMTV